MRVRNRSRLWGIIALAVLTSIALCAYGNAPPVYAASAPNPIGVLAAPPETIEEFVHVSRPGSWSAHSGGGVVYSMDGSIWTEQWGWHDEEYDDCDFMQLLLLGPWPAEERMLDPSYSPVTVLSDYVEAPQQDIQYLSKHPASLQVFIQDVWYILPVPAIDEEAWDGSGGIRLIGDCYTLTPLPDGHYRILVTYRDSDGADHYTASTPFDLIRQEDGSYLVQKTGSEVP